MNFIRENGQLCIVKCSSSYYKNSPLTNESLKIRHLGYFAQTEKFKHPVLVEGNDEYESVRVKSKPIE